MRFSLPAAMLIAALPLAATAQADDHDAGHAEDGEGMTQLTIDNAPSRGEVALLCAFTVECFEEEPCVSTTFAPTLSGNAGGMTPDDMMVEADLIADADTTAMLGLRSSGIYSLAGGSFDARHLLTIAASGSARYTVHLADGPISITYHGTCKETG